MSSSIERPSNEPQLGPNSASSSGSAIAFGAAMVVGALLRIYCVVFTNGTSDMDDWEDHAQQVHDRGLIGYYHFNSFANHPPFSFGLGWLILRTSGATGIPFRTLFRSLFAFLDAGNALLLFSLLRKERCRFFATAGYWLSPAAIIISAYHGNTDTAIAFFLLLSIWLAIKARTVASACAFGAGLWIKITGVLALPALLTFFRNWRLRLTFLATAAIVAVSTYLPALIRDYRVVWTNVFEYRGLVLQTTNGVPLWGPSVLFFSTIAPIQIWPEKYLKVALFILDRSWYIGISAMLLLMWLRRNRHSSNETCATIAMAYMILLGFSDNWAFQYFAWSLPFWFFLSWPFSIPAISLTSAYLYSLHWFFCGNGLLLGKWDFVGHRDLPRGILLLRDVTVLFFFVSGCVFIVLAARRPKASRAASNILVSSEKQ
jgi:hypothetical protein